MVEERRVSWTTAIYEGDYQFEFADAIMKVQRTLGGVNCVNRSGDGCFGGGGGCGCCSDGNSETHR